MLKDKRRVVTVALIALTGLLVALAGMRIGASQAAPFPASASAPSSAGDDNSPGALPEQAPQGSFQLIQTATLMVGVDEIMSGTWPMRVQEVYYNWPSAAILPLPSDAWNRSGGTPYGPITNWSPPIQPGAQSWITVSYYTRQRATRSGNVATLNVQAHLDDVYIDQITTTLIYTRQFPSADRLDYWGGTVPQLTSVVPGTEDRSDEEGWLRWTTTDGDFLGIVELQEPLLGSNLTITQFLVNPSELRLDQVNYFTVTVSNIGPVTASRWFYTELYIRAVSDPPPSGPYDHLWGLITYQGDALFRTPGENNWKVDTLGPGQSVILYTVITVTGIITGDTDYRAYAQVDTAYEGDVYQWNWFGADPEGLGVPPYAEEHNIAILPDILNVPAFYRVQAPSVVTKTGGPGFQVIHWVPVTNIGNVRDTYTVTVNSGTWIASAQQYFGPLDNMQMSNLPVRVMIPSGAPSGAVDTATVTVQSMGDPSRTATVIVKTIAERHYLPLVIKK